MLIKAKDAEYAGVKDDRANDIGQANQVWRLAELNVAFYI
jgi:hypothetical protein